jgi:hypothetical protein
MAHIVRLILSRLGIRRYWTAAEIAEIRTRAEDDAKRLGWLID